MADFYSKYPSVHYTPADEPLVEGKTPPPTSTGGILEFFTRGWRAEWTCLLVSILCSVAIAVILATSDGAPEPSWTRHLSLNALVAYIVTVDKLAILFVVSSCLSQIKWVYFRESEGALSSFSLLDQASRGTPGSLLFVVGALKRSAASLVRRHHGRVTWAKLLAFAGALATILSVFIDAFTQQLIQTSLRAVAVDRNASFAISHNYSTSSRADASGDGIYIPLSTTLDVGMYGAIYGGLFQESTPAIYSCASACVWNESSYVTLGISSSCQNVTAAALLTGNVTLDANGWESNYTVHTPGGIQLVARYGDTDYQTAITIATKRTYDYIGVPPGFQRFGILRTTNVGMDVLDTAQIDVYECLLSFAAYRYNNISANGTELRIGRRERVDLVHNGTLISNRTVVAFSQDDAGSADVPELTVHAVDLGAMSQLFESERFSGSIYDGESTPAAPLGIGAALLNANISAVFTSMADSMTAHIQLNDSAHAVAGSTVEQVLYIDISWAYAVLPLVVQLLAILLLALTMHINSRRRVQLWKESLVAALCHDIVPSSSSSNDNNNSSYTLRANIQSVEQLKLLENTRIQM